MISTVEWGGPADRAGLVIGDALLVVGNKPAEDVESLLNTLVSVGDTLRLRVVRSGAVTEIEVGFGAEGPGRAT